MHCPDTPTCRVIDLCVEETVVLEEKQVLLFLWSDPDVLRLDHPPLEAVQELPHLAQVVDDLWRVVRALANE